MLGVSLTAPGCCSVLVHLLPGLAMFAHRHFATPRGWRQWLSVASGALLPSPGADGGHAAAPAYGAARESAALAGLPQKALWLFCAPLLYYLAWQLLYFVVVQVRCLLSLPSSACRRAQLRSAQPSVLTAALLAGDVQKVYSRK
jgi:hypothetical protein